MRHQHRYQHDVCFQVRLIDFVNMCRIVLLTYLQVKKIPNLTMSIFVFHPCPEQTDCQSRMVSVCSHNLHIQFIPFFIMFVHTSTATDKIRTFLRTWVVSSNVVTRALTLMSGIMSCEAETGNSLKCANQKIRII